MFGASSIEKAVELNKQILSILASSCFILRKWVSNSPGVIKEIVSDELLLDFGTEVLFGGKSENKTLGHSNKTFSVITYQCQSYTKRAVLFSIAKIYDPSGLVSPCILIAKVTLQKLLF